MPRRPSRQDYSVGYGKPPAGNQFRAGVSGNPNGRPKGSLNVGRLLVRTLSEKVVINENGRRRTITKLEAAMKQLTNKAASGDLNAVRLLLACANAAEAKADQQPSELMAPVESDQRVIQGILRRIDGAYKGGKTHEPEQA